MYVMFFLSKFGWGIKTIYFPPHLASIVSAADKTD